MKQYGALDEAERYEFERAVLESIADKPSADQKKLMRTWLDKVGNKNRNKDLYMELLTIAGNVMCSKPRMEKWAESYLLKKKMKVEPTKMAYVYANQIGYPATMAPMFIADMQRIKSRLRQRKWRTGTPERRKGQEVVPVLRFKQTLQRKREVDRAAAKRSELPFILKGQQKPS